jgi:small GTP-binding protein
MARRALIPAPAPKPTPTSEAKHLRTKVCLVGDAAVGKTSLIRRYVLDAFDDSYLRTVGTKVSKRTMDVDFAEPRVAVRIDATIWDIMGHAGFRDLVADAYFAGARGILAVADLTRRETLDNLIGWIKGVRQIAGDVPVLVVVNKADLSVEAAYRAADAEAVAGGFRCPHVLASAKTGENVPIAFDRLGRMIAAAEFGLVDGGPRAVVRPIG